MLDQSFSAENFRNIFQIENRKGNLKKEMFPKEYINYIEQIKSLKVEIKEKSKEYKNEKVTKEEYKQFREEKNDRIKECEKKKDLVLYEQVKRISVNVNENFNFSISSEERNEKPVYLLDDSLEAFYAIKQLQYNIRKTFKVKQANRYHILKQIKLLLSDNFPKYVIRTDIKSFYESIPQSELLKKIEENTLLNYQSKNFIVDIIKEYENKKDDKFDRGKGIPRGIGISAYLAELYMRDIDSKIKSLENLAFYARYVDDIFIIFIPNNKNNTVNYFEQVNKIVEKTGLELQPETDEKTQLVDMFHTTEKFKESINYLGYKFTISAIKTKAMKNPIECRVVVNLSENKIKKYKKRIELSFAAYNRDSKYNERQARKRLFDCLSMLTGNTTLINSKKGIKVGVYFSNSLLEKDELEDLTNLDGFLTKIVHKNLIPYGELLFDIDKLRTQIKKTFSFQKGFENKKFHKFKIKELKVLKGIWKDETE